jgi:hypothetical protein
MGLHLMRTGGEMQGWDMSGMKMLLPHFELGATLYPRKKAIHMQY